MMYRLSLRYSDTVPCLGPALRMPVAARGAQNQVLSFSCFLVKYSDPLCYAPALPDVDDSYSCAEDDNNYGSRDEDSRDGR